MESIHELYRIGVGPSSSHTMAPKRAAELFRQENPNAVSYRVTLFGSLAATGKGHLTDLAIQSALSPVPVEFLWLPDQTLPFHPNGMRFEALDAARQVMDAKEFFSIGGGALSDGKAPRPSDCVYPNGKAPRPSDCVYPNGNMNAILAQCEKSGWSFWEYVESFEGPEIWDFLRDVWMTMRGAIERGLRAEGVLPGGLGLPRKAWSFFRKARMSGEHLRSPGYLSAYALAVAEENASGGLIVTAPTCGSSGVLPAVLRYVTETVDCPEESILRALATAGLIGNLIKHNASISGAAVGCQGEVGAACAMASGAAVQLLGGTIRQVEYAAEMGLEHHIGLTCDPVAGLVQIPCIERNAFAAMRAQACADYALFTDGSHRIPFDEIVQVMRQTGHDLPSIYRETSSGGMAAAYENRPNS